MEQIARRRFDDTCFREDLGDLFVGPTLFQQFVDQFSMRIKPLARRFRRQLFQNLGQSIFHWRAPPETLSAKARRPASIERPSNGLRTRFEFPSNIHCMSIERTSNMHWTSNERTSNRWPFREPRKTSAGALVKMERPDCRIAVARVTLRRGETSGAEPHTKGVGRSCLNYAL